MRAALRQEDLPRLSLHWTNVASSLGQQTERHLPRIADIERRGSDGAIRWVVSSNGQRPLKGLPLLAHLRDFGPYSSHDKNVSRFNTGTVARLGSFATDSIYRSTISRNIQLSEEALSGLCLALSTIQGRMHETFEPAMRPVFGDREALYFLNAAGRMLGIRH